MAIARVLSSMLCIIVAVGYVLMAIDVITPAWPTLWAAFAAAARLVLALVLMGIAALVSALGWATWMGIGERTGQPS